MKVRANQKGYYGGKLREEGEEFSLSDPAHLGSWMDTVDAPKPKRDPLDHDGDGKRGGSLPKAERVSTETTVAPPAKPAKQADPISGDEI